jgi:hypothetical protein
MAAGLDDATITKPFAEVRVACSRAGRGPRLVRINASSD